MKNQITIPNSKIYSAEIWHESLGGNRFDISSDETTLALIGSAVDAAKEAAHACRSEVARECFEFLVALLQESWIAESGQNARGAEEVISDVKCGLGLIAAVIGSASIR